MASLAQANEIESNNWIASLKVTSIGNCTIESKTSGWSINGFATMSACKVKIALPIQYCKESYRVFGANAFEFTAKNEHFKSTYSTFDCDDDGYRTAEQEARAECEAERTRLQLIVVDPKTTGCSKK